MPGSMPAAGAAYASHGVRSAWSPRRIPTCFASRWRSSFSSLSSRNSMSLSDGHLRKRSDIRSSRSRLALPSSVSSSAERLLGRFSITWAAISQLSLAPAPYGTLAGLLPSSPNHFRILADKLSVICIGTSLPPPSAQWPGGQRGKRGSGNAMVAGSLHARALTEPASTRSRPRCLLPGEGAHCS